MNIPETRGRRGKSLILKVPPHSRQRGVSLLEMSIAIAAMGLIAVSVTLVFRSSSSSTGERTADATLAMVENGIVGYALAHQKLPPVPADGWLSVTTLGLPQTGMTWYAADSRLVSGSSTYTPDPNARVPQLTAANGVTTLWSDYAPSPHVNFCASLQNAMSSPQILVGGVPAAFLIRISKAQDASISGFPLPGSAQAQELVSRGVRVKAIGIGELFTRLHCATQLSSLGSAAKAAVAARDLESIAESIGDFRQLQYERSQQAILSHDFQIALKSTMIANTTIGMTSVLESIASAIPGLLDSTTGTGLIALSTSGASLALALGSITQNLFYISSINVKTDSQGAQAAQAAVASAQQYATQLDTLFNQRLMQYQALVQGN